MTRKKTASDVVLEQPTHGGSYIRQPDGALERVEGPAIEEVVAVPDEAAGAEPRSDQSPADPPSADED